MDGELQEDLAEVLEGLDPLELLHDDPTLAEVAEEVCDLLDNDYQPVRVLLSSDESSSPILSSPEHTTESSDSSISGFELETLNGRATHHAKTRLKASCEVCGRPAGGHLNYGVLTCNSCRAFFSRSSKDNAYENFVCVNVKSDNNNLCKIDSASWRSCKKCRFRQCRQLGMKIKDKSVYDNSGDSSPYTVGEHLRMALTLTDKLTNDERAFIRSMVIKRLDCRIEHRARYLMRDPEYFRKKLYQAYHGQAIASKDFKLFEDFIMYGKLQTFSDGEFSADGLSRKDRVRLLSTNLPLANEFREAYRITTERWKSYDPFKGFEYLCKGHKPENKDYYYGIHNEVTQNGRLKPKKVGYDAMYDFKQMDILSKEQAQRHRKIVDKVSGLCLNGPDPVLPMFIASLIIYSPDFVDLDDPKSAERLQLQFASLLHRYLKCKQTPRREEIFRECMMVTYYVRELRSFREAAYKKTLTQRKN